MDQTLSCNPISVLVSAIPDTSGRCTGHVRHTQNINIFFLSLAIPDTSGRCRTETINPLLMILHLALVFLLCPASQQINCSTRELLKAPYGKHDNYQVKLISHLQYFTNMPIYESLSTKHIKWLS